jgi:microcystin-dependent protein
VNPISRFVQQSPTGKTIAKGVGVAALAATAQNTDMASSMVSATGGSRSHTNLMPALCVHFIIALFGIYPSRS